MAYRRDLHYLSKSVCVGLLLSTGLLWSDMVVGQAVRVESQEGQKAALERIIRQVESEMFPRLPSALPLGTGAITIHIPSPLLEPHVQRIAQILNLSEEQRQVLDALYRKYADEENQLRENDIKRLWQWSAAIASQGSRGSNPALTEEFGRLMNERNRVAKRLVS